MHVIQRKVERSMLRATLMDKIPNSITTTRTKDTVESILHLKWNEQDTWLRCLMDSGKGKLWNGGQNIPPIETEYDLLVGELMT